MHCEMLDIKLQIGGIAALYNPQTLQFVEVYEIEKIGDS